MLSLRFMVRRARGTGLSLLFAVEWLWGRPWWKSVLRLRWHCRTLPRGLVGNDTSTTALEEPDEQGVRS